jgi:fatty acid desaturase
MNITQQKQLIHTDQYYIQTIRPFLPKEAFQKKTNHLWYFCIYFLIFISAITLTRYSNNTWIFFIASLLAGNSLAGIVFFAHNLSHGSVIAKSWQRHFLEVLVWGLNFIPLTMWIHIHHRTHHPNAATFQDPDRRWLASEKTWIKWIYTWIFYPQKNPLIPGFINPFAYIHFVFYILRNFIAVFISPKSQLYIVPYQVPYTLKEKFSILGETAIILLIQAMIFFAIECSWLKYLFVGILPFFIAAAILVVYVATNHFLNPIKAQNNSVQGTTSVIVPPLFNKIHSNFSYHTEHHLFPSMHSDYYPLVSKLLKKHFPQDYNQLKITEAWRRLWNSQPFD